MREGKRIYGLRDDRVDPEQCYNSQEFMVPGRILETVHANESGYNVQKVQIMVIGVKPAPTR